jgi:hypothetical protein
MNEEIGVEELALEHYATLGFRGYAARPCAIAPNNILICLVL